MKRNDYLERILKARVYDVAVQTPLEPAPGLSRRLGNRLLLKREDLQPVFSFKLRGAYNKMASLSAAQKKRGVIAASAGNHAQAVALVAKRLKIPAVIVMPRDSPAVKLAATRGYGAEVILYDRLKDNREAIAKQLSEKRGLTLVPPFDHPHVFLDLGNDNEIICPYCSTLYRFAADLKAGEARPPECVLKDKVA